MDLVAAIRALRPNLLLAVDQEGGRVQRFQQGFTRFPPMHSFWRASSGDVAKVLPIVRDCGWLLAAEVLACGMDISFAPVLDVDDQRRAVIADRSFASDPQAAAELARACIAGMHEPGMASTGKHFPGHGGVEEDSHLALPVDMRDYHVLCQRDLIPFQQLIKQLDAIMPAHLLFPNIDNKPVGFSAFWLHDTLRKTLGFEGIIFSDDLTMAGAASVGDYGDRAEQALAAGCDAVLVCNNRDGALQVLQRLQQQHIQADNHLARMTAKNRMTWAELQNHPRRQATVNQLTNLLQSAT